MSGAPAPPTSAKPSLSRRWTFAILGFALLFVLMPFLFWNATWFGRPLTDEQISKSLGDHQHAREIQHALTQIEMRIERNDPSARRWYPRLVALSNDPLPEIRVTDAWVMGQDSSSPEFHDALRRMLSDPDPMVQRNAALSLVRFGDESGHDIIVSMLEPYAMPSPSSGTLRQRLKPGDTVNPGTMVGHIDAGDTASNEVRALVPGTLTAWTVPDKSQVSAGQTILALAPSPEMVWESLRALFLIGRPGDVAAIAPYARDIDGMAPQVKQQATLTLQRIRDRASS